MNTESIKLLPVDKDARSPVGKGPKKLSGIVKAANNPGKGIKTPKGVTPGDNFKRKK